MAEREPRRGAVRVVAAVADQQALGVVEHAVHRGGVQHRAVRLGGRDRDRQPPARLGITEQDIGQRVAHGLPGEPGLDHRGDLVGPRHQHRHAGVDHDDGPWIDRRDPPDQLILAAGQGQAGPVEALALGQVGRADHHDRGVGLAGGVDRRREHRLGVQGRHDAEPDGERSFAVGSGPELDSDLHLPVRTQVKTGPDLTGSGHRLDRIGGNHRRPVGDYLTVDRDRQVPDPGRAEQMRSR